MPTRSRKAALKYRRYLKTRKNAGCQFCAIADKNDVVVKTFKSFYVIKNIFPYTHWDLQSVSDHLMIIPKHHTETLSDLSAEESVEFVDILGSYENQGYNVYARAPQSSIKTVPHQHTHLIKPGSKTVRFLFYLKKPYLRFMR